MLVLEAFCAETYENTMHKIKIEYECCCSHTSIEDGPGSISCGFCPNEVKEYYLHTGICNLKTIKVNIPSYYPLKPKTNTSADKSITSVFVNNLEVSNFVKSLNYIELPPPRGVILPDTLPAGTKFLLISPDDIPENGTLVLL